MSICRLCDYKKKLIKAHIIPEAFYREILEDLNDKLMEMSADKSVHPKRCPIGKYDKNILCEDCDAKFGQLDEYGKKILIDSFKSPSMASLTGNPIEIEGDSQKLLAFLVSIVWRASISNETGYEKFDLGKKYSEFLKEKFTSSSTKLPPSFDAVLIRLDQKYPLLINKQLKNKAMEKLNIYELYLGEILAYIKVDNRDFPNELQEFSLVHNQAIKLLLQNEMPIFILKSLTKIFNTPHNQKFLNNKG